MIHCEKKQHVVGFIPYFTMNLHPCRIITLYLRSLFYSSKCNLWYHSMDMSLLTDLPRPYTSIKSLLGSLTQLNIKLLKVWIFCFFATLEMWVFVIWCNENPTFQLFFQLPVCVTVKHGKLP